LANSPYGIDVFDCSLLFAMLSWQYIDIKINLVELRESLCLKLGRSCFAAKVGLGFKIPSKRTE